jgi:hypothetical protein
MKWAIAIAVWFGVISVAAAEELKNDGFQSGNMAVFQGGFVSGEAGASRFVAPEAGRTLQKVTFLFGGATTQKTVTLKVWDDTAGQDAPGAELFAGDFQIMGNDSAFQQSDLSGNNITLPQQFRVGIFFQHDGFPSIARDTDNTIAADKNYIFTGGSWVRSQTLSLTGDWVIRAEISPGGSTLPDAGVTVDAPPNSGGACTGNAQCAVGQYCDVAHMMCTFDCRMNADCGGNGATCNSLGQCLDGDGGGCGCHANGTHGALGIALMMMLLLITRRKCATR